MVLHTPQTSFQDSITVRNHYSSDVIRHRGYWSKDFKKTSQMQMASFLQESTVAQQVGVKKYPDVMSTV